MRGDLGSPLVRAVVRLERVKRASLPRGWQWNRAVALRARLVRQMTEAEQDAALLLVVGEVHAVLRDSLARARWQRRAS